jgi:hypothetical protein
MHEIRYGHRVASVLVVPLTTNLDRANLAGTAVIHAAEGEPREPQLAAVPFGVALAAPAGDNVGSPTCCTHVTLRPLSAKRAYRVPAP